MRKCIDFDLEVRRSPLLAIMPPHMRDVKLFHARARDEGVVLIPAPPTHMQPLSYPDSYHLPEARDEVEMSKIG